jgi:hypothetical protein
LKFKKAAFAASLIVSTDQGLFQVEAKPKIRNTFDEMADILSAPLEA